MATTISQFVKYTAKGFVFADFVTIRAALIERYKEVYGSDIDLATSSADGVFVNDLSLLINNILQTMKTMYSNLDVNTASGINLTNLCRLSNVTRQSATKSNTTLLVTNLGGTNISESNMVFVDQSGNEWVPLETVVIPVGSTAVSIYVECTVAGSVSAPAGWINQTISATPIVSVVQENDANVGSEAESDSSLRLRRAQYTGASGVTVLQSVYSSLREISGISDVKIYNNNTNSIQTAQDGTSISAHDIYVILRLADGVSVADSTIGSTIFNKLTPGIGTTLTTIATAKSYTYVQSIASGNLSFNENVYWKECVAINPSITITLAPSDYFTTDEFDAISKTLFTYLNAKLIGEDLTDLELMIQATNADPKFKGSSTYSVSSVSIPSSVSSNQDTFLNYTTYSYTTSGTNYILTLS